MESHPLLARGVAASPGASSGTIVLDADRAKRLGREGKDVILVPEELTADDVYGMIQASGLLTVRGGMTSDASVVARGLGKPCVAGCEELAIHIQRTRIRQDDAARAAGRAAPPGELPHVARVRHVRARPRPHGSASAAHRNVRQEEHIDARPETPSPANPRADRT